VLAVCDVRGAFLFALGFTVGEIASLVLVFVLLPVMHKDAGHRVWK